MNSSLSTSLHYTIILIGKTRLAEEILHWNKQLDSFVRLSSVYLLFLLKVLLHILRELFYDNVFICHAI